MGAIMIDKAPQFLQALISKLAPLIPSEKHAAEYSCPSKFSASAATPMYKLS